jgi:DNA-binding transcriptional regulator YhcF (GntR family)
MKTKIEVDPGSQTPIYKQIVQSVQNMVSAGLYHEGDFIPSMNELANELEISKETVKKAYNILRERGVIESSHGKGFYVTNKNEEKIRILFIFDKISTYKQVLFNSIVKQIGYISENTICLHNQEIDLFEYFIDENIGHYDYYIVTPHFPLKPEIQKRAVKILKRIPNRKLIILDHLIKGLSGNFGSAYQDFEQDIYEGLRQAVEDLTKFKKLNVISMPGSMYAPLIEKGIKKFCQEYQVNYEIHNNIENSNIQIDETYFILNGQLDIELIELVKSARSKGYVIGKDIGIISYNESPINEIILDGLTVFSTNFKQMGELAAKMIIEKRMRKVRCDFSLIKRNTF